MRLQPSPIDEELQKFEELTVKLSQMCVEMSSKQRTEDFTNVELDEVIKQLHKGKSWPDEFPPEVFIYGGQELKDFVLEVTWFTWFTWFTQFPIYNTIISYKNN